ncbi:hypothetical protein AB6D30_18275 [Pectobacterium brasiliense]|uniref:hypothetical protein n=1 Tax=Pectobacterium brasiliense TaxID=180957 RepID=UPI0001A4422C|nr:hypothetical protein [Pectobacterium brasiliense]KGA23061.1 hypothetical protein KS44_15565 [Pectobacterium brasiliense]KHT15521.1 hypothetical protein RC95_15590 [Pectobacterium brasiliense]KRF60459.1 hypothetical protein AO825_14805 [Pectobacterium brasiliense]MBN3125247.1 hypothetical protein [Pectobacterium brasiliense]MBN3143568.1 hypothetical protein [Pectobacterium brasiliense]
MPTLSEYSNVYNTALNILDKKGFSIWYDEDLDMFFAEKNGWDFMSETPCGLLGIVSIYEYKKPSSYNEYWWRLDDKDLYVNIKKAKPTYTSVSDD